MAEILIFRSIVMHLLFASYSFVGNNIKSTLIMLNVVPLGLQ